MNRVELTGVAPSIEKYLAAVDDLAVRASAQGELDRAIILTAEMRQQIARIGAAGGHLDAITWAAWTTSLCDRLLAVLTGAVASTDDLAAIGDLPDPPTARSTAPAGPSTPEQYALLLG